MGPSRKQKMLEALTSDSVHLPRKKHLCDEPRPHRVFAPHFQSPSEAQALRSSYPVPQRGLVYGQVDSKISLASTNLVANTFIILNK